MRSATGASASSVHSAHRCMRRGPWQSNVDSSISTTSLSKRCGATTGWCCGCPSRLTNSLSKRSSSTPRTSTSLSSKHSLRRRCSPHASANARAERYCFRGADPTSAHRCGSNVKRQPTSWPSPPSSRRSPSCSRRPGSVSKTSLTCRRCAKCSVICAHARCVSSASIPARPARWHPAYCSTGSPRTCTKAMLRLPSDAQRRWRSTAICCGTSSVPKSCAIYSIPRCLPMSSYNCSA